MHQLRTGRNAQLRHGRQPLDQNHRGGRSGNGRWARAGGNTGSPADRIETAKGMNPTSAAGADCGTGPSAPARPRRLAQPTAGIAKLYGGKVRCGVGGGRPWRDDSGAGVRPRRQDEAKNRRDRCMSRGRATTDYGHREHQGRNGMVRRPAASDKRHVGQRTLKGPEPQERRPPAPAG